MVYTWSKGKILDILYIVGPRYFSREGVSALTLHPTPVPPPPPPRKKDYSCLKNRFDKQN